LVAVSVTRLSRFDFGFDFPPPELDFDLMELDFDLISA